MNAVPLPLTEPVFSVWGCVVMDTGPNSQVFQVQCGLAAP